MYTGCPEIIVQYFFGSEYIQKQDKKNILRDMPYKGARAPQLKIACQRLALEKYCQILLREVIIKQNQYTLLGW